MELTRRAATGWVLLLSVLPACSGEELSEPPGLDGSADDSGMFDAGLDVASSPADGGPGGAAGEPISAGPASASDGAEDPSRADVGDPSSCWDGTDNDMDLVSDCDDSTCDAVPACALGSGTRCTEELTGALDASTCAAGPATPACLGTGETTFGSPAPWVIGDRLHPGGDDFDSGLILADAIAPRTRRISMTGTFGDPSCPTSSCLELASFGITTTDTFDDTTRVRPTAVLQMSSARREVTLLLSGTTIHRWDFDPAEPTWTLDLRPSGDAVVMNGGVPMIRVPYAPPVTATAVIYGRNLNRAEDEPGGVGLEAFSFGTHVCDIPDAWESRQALSVVAESGGPVDTTTFRAPSVRRGGDGVLYLALEASGASGQGRIVLAVEDESPNRFSLAHPADSQILAPSDVETEVVGVGDPEIYWDGATWHLYFTGDVGGERRVGHASGPMLDALAFTGWVVQPSGNVSAVDEPSVTRSNDGRFILAVGMSRSGGRTIGIYVGRTAEGPFDEHLGGLDEALFRAGGGGTDFDGDEVGEPSIRVVDDAYNLYYAGRRGTRWSIGVWTSAELVYWRPVTVRRGILRGDGEGFDALGVRGPEILVEGASAKLFFVGEDGDQADLGVGIRPRPEFTP